MFRSFADDWSLLDVDSPVPSTHLDNTSYSNTDREYRVGDKYYGNLCRESEQVKRSGKQHKKSVSLDSSDLNGLMNLESISNRGRYRCGRCGQPKANHVCPYQEGTISSKESQTCSVSEMYSLFFGA